jgi:F0F1-type ATP synthase assembly protein I
MEKKDKIKERGKLLYAISLGSLIGFSLVIPAILFLLFGVYLDRKFQTSPIFLFSGVILGICVAFYETKKLILPFLEKRSETKT